MTGSAEGSDIKVVGGVINIPAYDSEGEGQNASGSPPSGPQSPDSAGAVKTGGAPEQGPDFEKLNAQLLAASFMTINAFLEAGGYEPCKFTDDEQELLTEIWKPYMPQMSPWVSAVVGTAVVLTPKAMLFMQIRNEKKKGVNPHASVSDKGSAILAPDVAGGPA